MEKIETKDVYQIKKIPMSLWDRVVKESEITDVSINKVIKHLLDKHLPKC